MGWGDERLARAVHDEMVVVGGGGGGVGMDDRHFGRDGGLVCAVGGGAFDRAGRPFDSSPRGPSRAVPTGPNIPFLWIFFLKTKGTYICYIILKYLT